MRPLSVIVAYLTYLAIAALFADSVSMTLAYGLFLPLLVHAILWMSLTSGFTYVFRGRIAEEPWRCLPAFLAFFWAMIASLVGILIWHAT